jgi:glycosyltransferase involved in cell wall biosynthesis
MVLAPMFSGLADGLSRGVWEPRGVPAVANLFEAFGRMPDIEAVYIFLTAEPVNDSSVRIPAIGRAHFLLGSDGPRLRRWLAFLRQTMLTIRLLRRERPDIVYAYNAAILPASLIARLRLAPVLMRFLGVHPFHKALAARRGGVLRWLYGAAFAQAICSRDGSGGLTYLPKLLSERTPLEVRLNGVDRPRADAAQIAAFRKRFDLSPSDRVVLFVGRLEPNKGPEAFVAGCAAALAACPGGFKAVVVGDGSARAATRAAIARSGQGDGFRMTGALPRKDVAAVYGVAEIYVSLNRFGNLSNANLEALSAGLCTLILAPDSSDATDIETQHVIPPGAALRLDRDRVVDSLRDALVTLLEDPDRVQKLKDAAMAASAEFETWNERVATEIALIRNAAGRS